MLNIRFLTAAWESMAAIQFLKKPQKEEMGGRRMSFGTEKGRCP